MTHLSYKPKKYNFNKTFLISGVVHEHPRIGSDGESEEGSGTSEDTNISPGSQDSNQSQNDLVSSLQKLYPIFRIKIIRQKNIFGSKTLVCGFQIMGWLLRMDIGPFSSFLSVM